MSAKHTPGPWKLDAIEGAHWNVDAEDGTAVALAQDNKDPGIRRANARLIAAAPELLEALEALESAFMAHTKWNGEPPQEIIKARAAINKSRN